MDMSGQIHGPAALSPRSHRYIPNRRQDGSQRRYASLPFLIPRIEPRFLGRPPSA